MAMTDPWSEAEAEPLKATLSFEHNESEKHRRSSGSSIEPVSAPDYEASEVRVCTYLPVFLLT